MIAAVRRERLEAVRACRWTGSSESELEDSAARRDGVCICAIRRRKRAQPHRPRAHGAAALGKALDDLRFVQHRRVNRDQRTSPCDSRARCRGRSADLDLHPGDNRALDALGDGVLMFEHLDGGRLCGGVAEDQAGARRLTAAGTPRCRRRGRSTQPAQAHGPSRTCTAARGWGRRAAGPASRRWSRRLKLAVGLVDDERHVAPARARANATISSSGGAVEVRLFGFRVAVAARRSSGSSAAIT